MTRLLLAIVLVVTIAGFLLAGCSAGQTATLSGVEVREYQGAKLDSINDFRENSIAGPQRVAIADYRLEIGGLVDKPLSLTYDQALARQQYKKVVTLNCVEGWSATVLWEGILLDDLFQQAGVKSGAVNVIFRSVDGYSSSLTLDYVRSNKILLASKMNEVTLPPERGYPFQVVAESKWGYKWAKWVNSIELSADANFQGFWESRGYNDNGDYAGSKFD